MSEEKPIAKTYIVCSVVIEKNGKYLLVQEKKPEVYGKWNLPGGRVDEGETLEQAAVREAKEECGLDVEIIDSLFVMHQAVDRPVLHAYSTRIIGGELDFPKDEILDAQWFILEEIKSMESELRNHEYILGAVEAIQ